MAIQKIPFPMKCAVDESIREAQMSACLRAGFPKLWPVRIDEHASLSIACYGPSLLDTWRDLTPPILSMSGAHDFLISRGIIPDYHVDMDPRVSKVAHILRPHPNIRYLMASCCHPFTWSVLRDQHVETFHVISGVHTRDWLSRFDPGALLVIAGSCIGIGAIHLGGVLGFRHFEIHGFDGSFREGTRHAGQHYGYSQKPIPMTAAGRTFQTSAIMHNSNVELLNVVQQYPFFAVFHGDGLAQSMIADAEAAGDLPHIARAGTEKADRIRHAHMRVDLVPVEESDHGARERVQLSV